MPGLPATGTLRYNNYVFDGATHVNVDVEFVRDESQRTVIGHRHIITVEAIVSGSDGVLPDLDSTLQNIRSRLGEQGKELVFINKGFGTDLIINTGLVRDIDFGPKPMILSWLPLGDDKAAQIVWRVETTIPVCGPGKRARRNGIISINYGSSYTIDSLGNTTRVLSGHLTIVNGNGIKDTADRYRKFFTPLTLPGFARSQTWKTSQDKRRLDFSITDTEIPSPNPYPKGIVDIRGSHRLSWRMGKEAGIWANNIEATIEGNAGLSVSQTWQVFLTIVEQRRRIAKERGRKNVFLLAVDVQEDLFGRPQQFSVQYQILGSVQDFVGLSGLWRPIGTDWTQWAVSLDDSVFDHRGFAQLGDVAGNDVIVNLCGPQIPVVPNNLQRRKRQLIPQFKGLQNYVPDNGDETYLKYRNKVTVHKQSPVTQQSVIQKPKSTDGNWNVYKRPPIGSPLYKKSADTLLGSPGDDTLIGPTGKDDIIQRSGDARYGVRIEGAARRAGTPTPAPYVSKVGERDVVEIRYQAGQTQLCEAFGVPVYDAWWSIDYLLDGPPGTVQTLPYFG